MKTVITLVALFFVATGFANEEPTFTLGQPAEVVNDQLGEEYEVEHEEVIDANGFIISPLKVGVQLENNLVNHSGTALVLGADASYLWEGLGAGLGCTVTYGTSAEGSEKGRALNRVRNDQTCFVQALIMESNGVQTGIRYGKGKTKFRNVDGFEADHTVVGLFAKSVGDGIEGEILYYRVEVPEEFRYEDDQDFNGNFLIRVNKVWN